MDKILIVDDDITLTMMLKTLLAKRGFEPLTASDAARAVETLSRHEDISLVLTDMRLPDKDGTYLLEWLGRQHRPLPVIVMTGYADIDNAVLSMKLGAADYITKPIRPDMLLEKIGEATAARRNRAEDAPKAAAKPLRGSTSIYRSWRLPTCRFSCAAPAAPARSMWRICFTSAAHAAANHSSP